MRVPRLYLPIVSLAACVALGSAAHAGSKIEVGLASAFARTGLNRIAMEPLTVDGLEGALILIQEALRLDPDNIEIWHMQMEVATLAERDDLKNQAIERLAKLDPSDEWIRFLRLNQAIDSYQTLPERVAAYEKMLSDENVARLGPPVSSRLALDLALLLRRQGDVDGFTKWLTQAVTIDRSNRSAAALAAGFFRMNVQDPFAEGELLVNVMLADPTDVTAQVSLAQLLLEHGAYVGANRIYQLILRSTRAAHVSSPNDLLADAAVAQWAAGDTKGALESIRKRQADIDLGVRNAARKKEDLSALELAKMKGPVDPNLATVRAVINLTQRTDQAAAAYQDMLAAYQAKIDTTKAAKPAAAAPGAADPPAATMPEVDEARKVDLATQYLQMAWVSLWLGNDTKTAAECLISAEEFQPLSDDAKARFEGCVAMRQGDAAKAVTMLAPLAEKNDTAARVGLALALLDQGDKKQAARQLLAANQAQPGSLIGIWAADKLAELLGQRLSLSEEARKLEGLIDTIPLPFDRYPDDSSQVLSVRLIPAALNYQPYEPVIVALEVTNNSLFPLGIDRDGPLKPQVLITPIVRVAADAKLGELRPFVVSLNRVLRLMPREKVVVSFDLRNHHTAEVLNSLAPGGVIVRLKAYVNFTATTGGDVMAGLYGCEVEGPMLRVDGVRADDEWIQSVMAAMQNPNVPGVVEEMAMLSFSIGPDPDADATVESKQLNQSARTAFVEAFSKLEGTAQAWLLCAMSDAESFAPVLDVARKSDNRLVQFAYLLFRANQLNDPMLDAALRKKDDVPLSRLAEIIAADAKRASEAVRKP